MFRIIGQIVIIINSGTGRRLGLRIIWLGRRVQSVGSLVRAYGGGVTRGGWRFLGGLCRIRPRGGRIGRGRWWVRDVFGKEFQVGRLVTAGKRK